MLNKYILNSKIRTGSGIIADNGRLTKADMVEMYVTEVDYDIILDAYQIDRVEVLEAYAAVKGRLNIEFIQFILDLYNDKTRLKGVKGQEDFYMKQKQMLNGLFGCCCTNILKSGVKYEIPEDSNIQDWIRPELTAEYIHEKLDELRNSNSNCFQYVTGVYCTAYARQRLYRAISKLDDIVVYYDTDSIKVKYNQRAYDVIDEENRIITAKLRAAMEDFELDPELLAPKDPKGSCHPLGVWEEEIEHFARRFRTLGAKRYVYETMDRELHITVSGVSPKYGWKALKGNIENFRKDLVFGYEAAHKLTSFYNDNQPHVYYRDYMGNINKSTLKYGICLQPMQYSMSISPAFEAYVEEQQNGYTNGKILI